jgi:hypothetical protein
MASKLVVVVALSPVSQIVGGIRSRLNRTGSAPSPDWIGLWDQYGHRLDCIRTNSTSCTALSRGKFSGKSSDAQRCELFWRINLARITVQIVRISPVSGN